ncbi:hypothetical protein KXS11_17200 [Plantibacter flavus]
MSVAIWWPAFTLGAWGQFFFDQLLTVWAAATGALFAVLIQRRGSRYRVRRVFALSIPSLWLALSFVTDSDSAPLLLDVLDLLAGAVALLGLPATLWVLARMMWPEFGEGISIARRWLVVLGVVVIAVIAFSLGANQSAFLTCGDFTISGNSEPPGCTR